VSMFSSLRRTALFAAAATALVVAGAAAAKTDSQAAKAAGDPNSPAKLIAKSKTETGLVFYGNPPSANWKVVTDKFHEKYPWITVTSYDLDNNTIFSKYASEAAQGVRTADMLVSSAPNLWVYARRQKMTIDYSPAQIAKFPSFVKQFKGVYVLSPDPAIIVYNKLILKDKVPASVTEIASDSGTYGKLTGYTIDNLFGYTALWGYIQKKGWSNLEKIG
jgi:iron(III) transport system substrate-binding protein